MAADDDTVSALDASRLLDVSERRVRQLAAAGALDVAAERPLRLRTVSVLAERDRRRSKPRTRPETPATASAGALDVEQLRQLVAAIVADLVPLAIEGQRRVEDMLREELAATRAELEQLRQERAADVERSTSRPRRWWSR